MGPGRADTKANIPNDDGNSMRSAVANAAMTLGNPGTPIWFLEAFS